MFEKKFVRKIKTRISYSITFFPENRAVYEIVWKNIVEPDKPQVTIWRLPFAWGIIRLQTHSQNV